MLDQFRKCRVLLIAIGILITGCHTSKTDLVRSITHQLKDNAQEHGIPAQALLIMHNNSVLYRDSFGVRNLNTSEQISHDDIFPVYSISKIFASTLVMQLLETDKLKLTDMLSQFIPNLPVSWQSIRVEQLLNHTSGLPEYFNCYNEVCEFPVSAHSAISGLYDVPLLFEPDTQMQYNQTNYLLLKLIIESVTKTSYREAIENKIINPLKLKSTWIGLKDVPQYRMVTPYLPRSDGALTENKMLFPDYANSHADAYSTLNDLGVFLSALAQGKLVSKKFLIEHWKPYQLTHGEKGYFAAGWDYDSSGRWQEIGHDGGGLVRVRVLFQDTLDNHYLIVYLTNGNNDGVWSRTLVDSVQFFIIPDMFSRISTLF